MRRKLCLSEVCADLIVLPVPSTLIFITDEFLLHISRYIGDGREWSLPHCSGTLTDDLFLESLGPDIGFEEAFRFRQGIRVDNPTCHPKRKVQVATSCAALGRGRSSQE